MAFRRGEVEEESIYNLIPEVVVEPPKGPLYRSMHPKKTEPRELPGTTFPKTKKPAGTMGPLKVPHPAEQPFLKKKEKEPKLPAPSKFDYTTASRKPAVVKRDQKPVMGLVTEKNFITSNAVDVIMTEAKRPKDTTVDYLKKPDFGKKPAYLERVKEEVAEEYRQISEWKQQTEMQMAPPGMRQLEEDERQMILDGLKEKWAALNKQYQTMSFTVDTINKRTRKEEYERQLADLEKDIERMSKKFVYVSLD